VSAHSLSGLRSACGTEATLQNLLEITVAKLQTCGRLAVLEYEARVEGHDSAATAFRELGVTERTACRALLQHLRRHLDETLDPDATGSSSPPGRDAR
jgi:DNA-directed RNA polymerase subunit N (RpoN/RPB10)